MAAGAAQLAPLQNRAQSCSGARREISARPYAISIGQLCAFYCAIQPASKLPCRANGAGELMGLLLERDAMSRLKAAQARNQIEQKPDPLAAVAHSGRHFAL